MQKLLKWKKFTPILALPILAALAPLLDPAAEAQDACRFVEDLRAKFQQSSEKPLASVSLQYDGEHVYVKVDEDILLKVF